MMDKYLNITLDNIDMEHICCAISDKKHQDGVDLKKEWLRDRIKEGHVFRKLNERGKVFIEYSLLEKAWVPIVGDNYIYIYCLWVSGSFKGNGHAKSLIEYCINDAKEKGKSGICVLSSKKKKPFLSEKEFFLKYGFKVVESIGEYELLALSFDTKLPMFNESVKKEEIDSKDLTIFYTNQCPYIPNCIEQIRSYCINEKIPLNLIKIDSLEKAKNIPCIFNNWAVFNKGKFETVHLLNEGLLKKIL
ncbi:MAG: GNAT family N-acetyltransferase [Bacilli bacterium]|nr:GNAT family N-acetyltransferase [Bacilli bacterium]